MLKTLPMLIFALLNVCFNGRTEAATEPAATEQYAIQLSRKPTQKQLRIVSKQMAKVIAELNGRHVLGCGERTLLVQEASMSTLLKTANGRFEHVEEIREPLDLEDPLRFTYHLGFTYIIREGEVPPKGKGLSMRIGLWYRGNKCLHLGIREAYAEPWDK
jgi:hypothetical protein